MVALYSRLEQSSMQMLDSPHETITLLQSIPASTSDIQTSPFPFVVFQELFIDPVSRLGVRSTRRALSSACAHWACALAYIRPHLN